jgi:hypothetical protein
MLGALMLVALAACGVAVALWDRETVVLDFPPEEARSCFIVSHLVRVQIGGSDITAAIRSIEGFGYVLAEYGRTANEVGRAIEQAIADGTFDRLG